MDADRKRNRTNLLRLRPTTVLVPYAREKGGGGWYVHYYLWKQTAHPHNNKETTLINRVCVKRGDGRSFG